MAVAIAAACFAAAATKAQAQISVGVDIGAAPDCPYGYYDYAPYPCAPYGYYGPEWFSGGVFIGAGPWFHGPAGFHGHVTTTLTRNMGTRGRCRTRATNRARITIWIKLRTSKETKCETDMDHLAGTTNIIDRS
jgi:hypothetical protein